MDASQPKLSDERDKCNDKRLMLKSFKETQFQTEEMQDEFKISCPVEFVAQQPVQITRRSPRLACANYKKISKDDRIKIGTHHHGELQMFDKWNT